MSFDSLLSSLCPCCVPFPRYSLIYQNISRPRDSKRSPFEGCLACADYSWRILATISLQNNPEVSGFTRSKYMKQDQALKTRCNLWWLESLKEVIGSVVVGYSTYDLFTFHGICVLDLYCFWDVASYLSKVAYYPSPVNSRILHIIVAAGKYIYVARH